MISDSPSHLHNVRSYTPVCLHAVTASDCYCYKAKEKKKKKKGLKKSINRNQRRQKNERKIREKASQPERYTETIKTRYNAIQQLKHNEGKKEKK